MEEDSTAPVYVKDFVEKRAVQIADLLKVQCFVNTYKIVNRSWTIPD